MNLPTLKILICDDHALIREGLKHMLKQGGLECHLGQAANAAEAMGAIRREKWDVLILDISLPGRSGIDVLKEITEEFPHLPVLMLSHHPEEHFALRALRAGARGYLNKNLNPHDMIAAIRRVAGGGQYISAKVAAELVSEVQQPEGRPPHAALSDREDQVLRQIGAGRTVSEIAARLSLSVKTISTYRAIILTKLGLKNNAQVMRYAMAHGLEE